MRKETITLLVAASLLFILSACKEGGQGREEKKEEAAQSAELEKVKAEAEKKIAEATQSAQEAAKKAEAEAKAKIEAAKAEAEKAKAELERAKAEAEEEKEQLKEKVAREGLTRELAHITGEMEKRSKILSDARDAWREVDSAKYEKLGEAVARLERLEGERSAVEGLMVQGKLDEARTKLEMLKAKFSQFATEVEELTSEQPVDPRKWESMLRILAGETCLTQKNLPVQEFQRQREELFGRYQMDRVEYEQLRARYNQGHKPEDQAKLGQFLKEACAPPAEGTPEGGRAESTPAEGTPADAASAPTQAESAKGAVEEGKLEKEKPEESKPQEKGPEQGKPEEGKPEEKAKALDISGTFTGPILNTGEKSTATIKVKNGKLISASATIGNVKFNLKGDFGPKFKLTGRSGPNKIECSLTADATHVSGVCHGNVAGRSFKKARLITRK